MFLLWVKQNEREGRVQLLNSDVFVLFALSLRRQPTLWGAGGVAHNLLWFFVLFCFNHRKGILESVILSR